MPICLDFYVLFTFIGSCHNNPINQKTVEVYEMP